MLTVVAEDLGDYVIGAQHEEHFAPWRELEGYRWLMRLEAGDGRANAQSREQRTRMTKTGLIRAIPPPLQGRDHIGIRFYMESIRCGSCNRLLLRAKPDAMVRGIEVKCPRCGTLNHISLRAQGKPASPAPERQRASSPEDRAQWPPGERKPPGGP